MKALRRPALLILVALPAASCAGTNDGGWTNARVDTLASGRVLVTNTGEPLWTPETAWNLEEDLRIGTAAANGPAEAQFARVFDLTTDSQGRIYVLDLAAPAVRVFEPDGSFAHAIGRPGEGPGELSAPIELSMAAGDSLWVADQGTGRYSVFAPDGAFVRVLQSPPFLMQLPGHALPGGRYLKWGFRFPDGGFGRVELLPIRVGPTADAADTFPPIRFSQRLMEGDRPAVFFGADPTGTVARDGTIWFGHADAYTIHRRTLEGDTTLTLAHPAVPHALEEADRAAVDARLSDPPTPLRDAYLAALPEVRPILSAVASDGAGHLYVLVDVAGTPAGTALDVFEDDGGYLGRLELPTPAIYSPLSSPLIRATRDHLYVVVSDELDVQYVSRLRIVRP